MSARVIAIANWKGGSGKTSTAVNLSACLATLGKKILVIDLDPQSHATISLGILPYNLQNTVYEMFLSMSQNIEDYLRLTQVENLYLIPATKRLINIESEMLLYAEKELRLKEIIGKFLNYFDFILFDCPPSLGLLTINALLASSEILIPMQTHFLALEGLSQIVEAVNHLKKSLNANIKISGIIPTMTNMQTRLSKEIIYEIKKHFGEKMILHPVRNDIKIAEAPGHRKPLLLYAPNSRGALDYKILTEQVINQTDYVTGNL